MSGAPFLLWPDSRLKEVAAPVEKIDAEVAQTWERMLKAMYAMPGVGLAAPQLGIGLRLAVLDCSDTRDQAVRLANPRIVTESEELRTGADGSPNLPGLFEKVTRPEWVEVVYIDETGTEVTRTFRDLWSASIQHQIDHHQGRMFFDRLSPLKRKRLLAKHQKASRRIGKGN